MAGELTLKALYRVFDILHRDNSILEAINYLSTDLVRLPIALLDGNFQLIACSNYCLKHPFDIWDVLTQKRQYPLSRAKMFSENKDSAFSNSLILPTEDEKQKSVNSPFFYKEYLIYPKSNQPSYIFYAVETTDTPLSDFNILIFEYVLDYISSPRRSQKLLPISPAPYAPPITFLQLLNSSEEIIAEVDDAGNFDKTFFSCGDIKKHLIVVEEYDSFTQGNITAAANLLLFAEQITTTFPEETIVYIFDNIVCIILSDNIPINQFLEKVAPFLSEQKLFAGVSLPFATTQNVCHYFETAKVAARIGKRLPLCVPYALYDTIAVRYFVYTANQKDNDMIKYCSPEILALCNYDINYGTQYVQTLRTYFKTDMNMTTTAKLLCIHQNTLKYRLCKIKRLLNTEFDDLYYVFRLRLSLVILRHLKIISPFDDHYDSH